MSRGLARRREEMTRALDAIEAAVRETVRELPLPVTPSFRDLVRKEFASVPDVDVSLSAMRHEEINALYELRSQLLDWTTETGFLGFFDPNPGRRYTYRRRLEVLLELLPDLHGKRILEVGCASGILASLLAPRAREVVGIDVTPTAILFARTLSRNLSHFNTRFLEGDAHHLDFPNASFDLIVSMEVFEHLLDTDRALEETHRVLRPDGLLVMTTTTAASPSDAIAKVIRLFRKDFYVDAEEQFDKKAYLAAKTKGLDVTPTVFRRIHHRFGYRQLTGKFRDHRFSVVRAKGATLAFPPIYLAVYHFLPNALLPIVRWLEELLNELGVFKRVGSVTTCFSLRRQ